MRRPNTGKNAARASWIAPIFFFALGELLIHEDTDIATTGVIVIIQCILALIGVGAAVYALISMKKFGLNGILVPAAIGLALNITYLTFVIRVIYRITCI